mmetsp:Transcript_34380/g.98669  ORF Transcript_34380/g.98669 Transcript_34380/m.98669 type:complete len:139 (+) Transcript_34380:424-840(+)
MLPEQKTTTQLRPFEPKRHHHRGAHDRWPSCEQPWSTSGHHQRLLSPILSISSASDSGISVALQSTSKDAEMAAKLAVAATRSEISPVQNARCWSFVEQSATANATNWEIQAKDDTMFKTLIEHTFGSSHPASAAPTI